MTTWTVIDEQRARTVDLGPGLEFDPSVLGWERKPEGLCRDDVCVPVAAGATLRIEDVGRLLRRPVVVDRIEHVAAFAASASDRADALRSGIAPDFELPDVDGVLHRLSDHRGHKVVLYAYASW